MTGREAGIGSLSLANEEPAGQLQLDDVIPAFGNLDALREVPHRRLLVPSWQRRQRSHLHSRHTHWCYSGPHLMKCLPWVLSYIASSYRLSLSKCRRPAASRGAVTDPDSECSASATPLRTLHAISNPYTTVRDAKFDCLSIRYSSEASKEIQMPVPFPSELPPRRKLRAKVNVLDFQPLVLHLLLYRLIHVSPSFMILDVHDTSSALCCYCR